MLSDRQLKQMWRTIFFKLQLEREDVVKLYSIFLEITVLRLHSMSYSEMILAIRAEDSHFSRTLFNNFLISEQSRSSRAVCFKDFVKSVWHYCSLSKHHMGKLCHFCHV